MTLSETDSENEKPVGLLSAWDVIARIGVSRATIYRMVDSGEFPSPVKISPGRRAWVEAEVNAWLADRLAERRKGTPDE